MAPLNPRTAGIALLLGAALLFSLWLGIGFGLGALSVAPPQGFSYTQQPFEVSGGGLEVTVAITSYTQAGSIPTTSMTESGVSTVLTAVATVSSPNPSNCGDSNNPVWAPGTGADYTPYWQFFIAGGPAFSINVNGETYASNSGNNIQIPISQGGTFYCLSPASGFSGNDALTPGMIQGIEYTSISWTINGQVADGAGLYVNLFGPGTFCGGSGGGGTVCSQAESQAGNAYGGSANGGFQINAGAQITSESAASSISGCEGGPYFNGGSFTIGASTGFAGQGAQGPGTYTLEVEYPPARGGGVDPNFPAQVIQSDDLNYEHTFTIPAGTSVNSSTPGWNNFYVYLVTSLYVVGSVRCGIDISPQYAPQTPTILYHNSGTFLEPQAGDTEYLSVYANASAHSGPVTAILLWAYYVPAGTNPQELPGGAGYYIGGSESGAQLPLTFNGNNSYGTFSFPVQPVTGTDEIGIQVEAENGQAQPSPTAYSLINVAPLGCVPGAPGCPTQNGATLWELLGPALLSAAALLAVLAIAVWVPMPWVRYGLPIIVGVVIIVLYVTGEFTALFNYGGVFNSGVH
jgi:hypothetical protein